jgi:hypothetical protein
MKRLYLTLSWLSIIAIVILYFQLLIGIVIQVPFFASYIDVSMYVVYQLLLAFFAWIFITLGISNFNSSSDLDDDFDL